MDIDVIDGQRCLVFAQDDPVVEVLRLARNTEVFNRMMTGEASVGVEERKLRKIVTPRLLKQLHSLGLMRAEPRRVECGQDTWGYAMTKAVDHWTVTPLGDEVLEALGKADGEEVLIPFGSADPHALRRKRAAQ